jgi:hypothetical protein
MTEIAVLNRDSAIRLLRELEDAGCLSAVALDVPDDLSPDRFDALCAYLGSLSHATRWWIGDLICWGEGRYAERVAQGSELFGLAPGTLQNYASVCDRVAPRRRRPGVPFHCHALVARLEPAEQDRWLAVAAERGLNYRELRVEMEKADALPAPAPKPDWTTSEPTGLTAEAGPPASDAAEAAGELAGVNSSAGTGDGDGGGLEDRRATAPSLPPGPSSSSSPHAVTLAQIRDRYNSAIDRGQPPPQTRRSDLLERERDALTWALAALAPELA